MRRSGQQPKRKRGKSSKSVAASLVRERVEADLRSESDEESSLSDSVVQASQSLPSSSDSASASEELSPDEQRGGTSQYDSRGKKKAKEKRKCKAVDKHGKVRQRSELEPVAGSSRFMLAGVKCGMCGKTSRDPGVRFVHKARCENCVEVAKSWMGQPWDLLLKLYQQSASFRGEWDEAVQNLGDGPVVKGKFEFKAEVKAVKKRKMVCSMTYYFLTLNQFIHRFKYEPKVLNVKVTSCIEEFGTQELRGVLVLPDALTDGNTEHYRRVTMSHETSWMVDETLRSDSQRLRVVEPTSIFEILNKNDAKKHSELRNKKAPVPTLADLTAAMEDERKRQKAIQKAKDRGDDVGGGHASTMVVEGEKPASSVLVQLASSDFATPNKGQRKARLCTPSSKVDAVESGVKMGGGRSETTDTINPLFIMWGYSQKAQLAGVQRSLNHGKADEKTSILLEKVREYATCAQRLYSITQEQLSLSHYAEMEELLRLLGIHNYRPTMNVARFWVAVSAVRQFTLKSFGLGVELIAPVAPPGMYVESEEGPTFDIVNPCLWVVAPRADDEDQANAVPAQQPNEDEVEVSAWQEHKMIEAFDEGTRNFKKWFLNHCIANNVILTYLREDVQLGCAFFTAWLEYRGRCEGSEHYFVLGSSVKAALDVVDVFAKAYRTVVSDDAVFTPDTHAAFAEVFVETPQPQRACSLAREQREFIQLMVAASRRSKDWASLEDQAVNVAAHELEHGSRFVAHQKTLEIAAKEGTTITVDELVEIYANRDVWSQFRKVAWTKMQHNMLLALLGKLNGHDDPKNEAWQLDGIARKALYDSFFAMLDYFDTADPALGKKATEMRIVLKEASKCLTNGNAIQALKSSLDNAKQPDRADLVLSDEFCVTLQAVADEEVPKVDTELAELEALGAAALQSLLANISIGGEEIYEKALKAIRNFMLLLDRRAEKTEYQGAMLKSLIEKGLGLHRAGSKFSAVQSKINFSALSKAATAWFSLRLPQNLKPFARHVLEAELNHLTTWREQKAKIVAEEGAALSRLEEGFRKVARGKKADQDWKDDLPSDRDKLTVEEILEAASRPEGLLAGPGAKISQANTVLTEAMKKYEAECAKLSEKPDDAVLNACKTTIAMCQTTTFESYLCRSLKKKDPERTESLRKYLTIFATVPPSSLGKVQILYTEAKAAVSKKEKGSASASFMGEATEKKKMKTKP